jgi:UDP-N-acetylglucosamine acyltransferase
VNIEGMKRRGFTRPQIDAVRAAYKTIYRNNLTLDEAKTELAGAHAAGGEGADQYGEMLAFLGVATRGIVR